MKIVPPDAVRRGECLDDLARDETGVLGFCQF